MFDLPVFLIVLIVLVVLRIAVHGLDAITKAENKNARKTCNKRFRD